MRHEAISLSEDKVELARLNGLSAAEIPFTAAQPAAAAPDVPLAAGKLLAAVYATLLGTLALATTGPDKSLLAIAVAGFFLFMFFAVPAMFFGVEGGNRERVRFDRFMDEGMMTLTGHCSGRAALVQMLIVPVLLTGGAIVIGIAAAIIF